MRRKFFYIPGLISISLLPILGCSFIWYTNLDKSQQAVEFMIIDANIEDPYYYDMVYDTLHINHQSFEIANSKHFNRLQDTIGFYLDQVTNEKSFCVHFQNGTTYQNLIDVLDVFSNYDIVSFKMKKNSLYVIPKKYYNDDVLDLVIIDDQQKDVVSSGFKKVFNNMIWPYKLIYLFYIVFVLMVIVRDIKKRLPI